MGEGWRKRAGPFYTRLLAPGALGLLALSPNRGLPHQWRLQPYVGVVHERVNALADALVGSTGQSPYPQATIRSALVRLLDGPQAIEGDRWLIAAEALIYELRAGNGPVRRTPFLTAALWISGEVAAAEAQLDQIASQLAAPTPQSPEPLRGGRVTRFGASAPPEGWPRHGFEAFATRLRAGMSQFPDGPPSGWRPPLDC